MGVSNEQAMQMFKQDLSLLMDQVAGLLAHYRISDWDTYILFRKAGCPESYVLEYQVKAGDELAQKIRALHIADATTQKGERVE